MKESNESQQAIIEQHYLQLAIDTIRLNAINERVSAIRQSLEHKPERAIIRNMYAISMRVAAICILAVGSAALYKYISVNDQSVYEKQFITYELSNTRGVETHNPEVQSYQDKNWSEVVSNYTKVKNPSNRSIFLAAMADMQLRHFPDAVSLLGQILNLKSEDHSYRDEAEYYLALAFLMNHQADKGIQLLDKIRADRNHTYYPMALELSAIDMKIIVLKKQVTSEAPAVTQ